MMINAIRPMVSFKAATITKEVRDAAASEASKESYNMERLNSSLNETYKSRGYDVELGIDQKTGVSDKYLYLKAIPKKGGEPIIKCAEHPMHEGYPLHRLSEINKSLTLRLDRKLILEKCREESSPIRIIDGSREMGTDPESTPNLFYTNTLVAQIKESLPKYENGPLRIDIVREYDEYSHGGTYVNDARLVNKATGEILTSRNMGYCCAGKAEDVAYAFQHINELADRYLNVYKQGFDAGQKAAVKKS